jgi:hypothetical protein
LAKVRGREKMPAPTMPPTTIAVSASRDIFWSLAIVFPKGTSCPVLRGAEVGAGKLAPPTDLRR